MSKICHELSQKKLRFSTKKSFMKKSATWKVFVSAPAEAAIAAATAAVATIAATAITTAATTWSSRSSASSGSSRSTGSSRSSGSSESSGSSRSSENIWFVWSRICYKGEKLKCHACDGRTDLWMETGK